MKKTGNGMVRLSEESITLMTPYRLIQGSWSRPSEGAVAHVVRLRILACRNDLNRKRIFSLQLVAYSQQLTAFLIMMPYRIPSFRAEVRMLYEKDRKRDSDTE